MTYYYDNQYDNYLWSDDEDDSEMIINVKTIKTLSMISLRLGMKRTVIMLST